MGRLILFVFFLFLCGVGVYLLGFQSNFDQTKSLGSILSDSKPKSANGSGEDEQPKVDPNVAHLEMLKKKFPEAYAIYTGEAQCIKCHGEYGQGSEVEEAPLIAGQFDWYVIDQVTQMKSGIRVNEKMMPYLEKIGDTEIAQLAEFIQAMRVK
ncbi:c-type cytochrome [Bacteriovoracaceae bacterium]|nr:c-type cytochrome [Bacteriovoracaceae bacterium]